MSIFRDTSHFEISPSTVAIYRTSLQTCRLCLPLNRPKRPHQYFAWTTTNGTHTGINSNKNTGIETQKYKHPKHTERYSHILRPWPTLKKRNFNIWQNKHTIKSRKQRKESKGKKAKEVRQQRKEKKYKIKTKTKGSQAPNPISRSRTWALLVTHKVPT